MCLVSPRTSMFPVLCLLVVTAPHESAGQGSVFKTGVEMVALTVTVTDANGQCVSGLTADDFAVFEDGIQQTVTLFGSEEIPVDVALILDTSSSMHHALPIAKTAAQALVDRLRPADRAALIDVKGSTTIPLPFTDDRGRVAAAVTAMSARGTTALYDGVYVSLREFERERRQRPEMRRHALIVTLRWRRYVEPRHLRRRRAPRPYAGRDDLHDCVAGLRLDGDHGARGPRASRQLGNARVGCRNRRSRVLPIHSGGPGGGLRGDRARADESVCARLCVVCSSPEWRLQTRDAAARAARAGPCPDANRLRCKRTCGVAYRRGGR